MARKKKTSLPEHALLRTWEQMKEIEYYVKLNHEFGKYYEYRMKPKGTQRVSSKKDEKNS